MLSRPPAKAYQNDRPSQLELGKQALSILAGGRTLARSDPLQFHKTQWQLLLQEMAWMAVDFQEEKKWKLHAARCLAMTIRRDCKSKKLDQSRPISSASAAAIQSFWLGIAYQVAPHTVDKELLPYVLHIPKIDHSKNDQDSRKLTTVKCEETDDNVELEECPTWSKKQEAENVVYPNLSPALHLYCINVFRNACVAAEVPLETSDNSTSPPDESQQEMLDSLGQSSDDEPPIDISCIKNNILSIEIIPPSFWGDLSSTKLGFCDMDAYKFARDNSIESALHEFQAKGAAVSHLEIKPPNFELDFINIFGLLTNSDDYDTLLLNLYVSSCDGLFKHVSHSQINAAIAASPNITRPLDRNKSSVIGDNLKLKERKKHRRRSDFYKINPVTDESIAPPQQFSDPLAWDPLEIYYLQVYVKLFMEQDPSHSSKAIKINWELVSHSVTAVMGASGASHRIHSAKQCKEKWLGLCENASLIDTNDLPSLQDFAHDEINEITICGSYEQQSLPSICTFTSLSTLQSLNATLFFNRNINAKFKSEHPKYIEVEELTGTKDNPKSEKTKVYFDIKSELEAVSQRHLSKSSNELWDLNANEKLSSYLQPTLENALNSSHFAAPNSQTMHSSVQNVPEPLYDIWDTEQLSTGMTAFSLLNNNDTKVNVKVDQTESLSLKYIASVVCMFANNMKRRSAPNLNFSNAFRLCDFVSNAALYNPNYIMHPHQSHKTLYNKLSEFSTEFPSAQVKSDSRTSKDVDSSGSHLGKTFVSLQDHPNIRLQFQLAEIARERLRQQPGNLVTLPLPRKPSLAEFLAHRENSSVSKSKHETARRGVNSYQQNIQAIPPKSIDPSSFHRPGTSQVQNLNPQYSTDTCLKRRHPSSPLPRSKMFEQGALDRQMDSEHSQYSPNYSPISQGHIPSGTLPVGEMSPAPQIPGYRPSFDSIRGRRKAMVSSRKKCRMTHLNASPMHSHMQPVPMDSVNHPYDSTMPCHNLEQNMLQQQIQSRYGYQNVMTNPMRMGGTGGLPPKPPYQQSLPMQGMKTLDASTPSGAGRQGMVSDEILSDPRDHPALHSSEGSQNANGPNPRNYHFPYHAPSQYSQKPECNMQHTMPNSIWMRIDGNPGNHALINVMPNNGGENPNRVQPSRQQRH